MKRELRDRLIILTALCGFAAYLALGIMHHEAWRDEWQAINIARAATSLPDLYERLRYEGHPALWYLCIKGVWAIAPALVSVQVLNAAFAMSAAGLVAFLAPWPLWLRLMVAFTGPTAWEYSVKARSYGLGWLLIVALALVLRRPADRLKPWLVALLATLALNTSIFTGLVAFSLVLGWLWEEYKGNRLRPLLLSMALVAAAAGGTFWLALPPADAAIGLAMKPMGAEKVKTLIRLFSDSLLPYTGIGQMHLSVALVAAALLITACFWGLCRCTGARIALACTWFSITFFLVHKIAAKPWHQWHLFLAPFAVVIAFEQRKMLPRSAIVILAGLGTIGLICGVREYLHDEKAIYSAARQTAQGIKSAGLDGLPIVVSTDYFISSLSGYLGRPLYDNSCQGETTYVVWRNRAFTGLDAFECAYNLTKNSPAHNSLFVHSLPLSNETIALFSNQYKIGLTPIGSYISDFAGGQRYITLENYHVYMLTRMQP